MESTVNDVSFIRKNGRIIPIRNDGRRNPNIKIKRKKVSVGETIGRDTVSGAGIGMVATLFGGPATMALGAAAGAVVGTAVGAVRAAFFRPSDYVATKNRSIKRRKK